MHKNQITVDTFAEGHTSVTFKRSDGFSVTFDFKDGFPMTGSSAQRRVAEQYPDLFRAANRVVSW